MSFVGQPIATPQTPQPGLTIPEQVIVGLLSGEMAKIQKDPALVRQALAAYGPAFEGQMRAVFARRALPVYEGWPTNAEMLPGIGVTLRPAAEDILGIQGSIAVTDDGVELYGRQMQASVVCTCYATAQREANAIAHVVSFLLMIHSQYLEGVEGLYNTSVAITDIRPEEDAPLKLQYLFMRAVSLQCMYMDTWALTYPIAGASEGGASDEP